MAHAKKPDFILRRNGRVHLNRPAGASFQSTTVSRGVRISGSNSGYSMLRGSVKGTGYQLHSTVSPSLPLPCVTVCQMRGSPVLFWIILLISFCRSAMLWRRLAQTWLLEMTLQNVITKTNVKWRGPGSSVGIVTDYGLDGPGSKIKKYENLCVCVCGGGVAQSV